ncbi:MAG TPA: hypothetical protein VFX28_20630, partial [Methylomirabilota bacterium]|nr:hypothetical protein [Methylomirabilota bacterium]
TSPAIAQTPVEGAYENLSPANQRVARALYEAQVPNPVPARGSSSRPGVSSSTSKTLSLDEIAAMKQGGKGWSQVFKEMHAKGLVHDTQLGQVVSRYNQQRPASGVVVTAARAYPKSRPEHALKAEGDEASAAGVTD